MKRNIFGMIRHAITMVNKNLKSYMLLSVTIVLSFALLFGYLVYTDSSLYNEYKHIFSKDRNVLSLYDSHMEDDKLELLLRQVEKMENTYYYVSYDTSAIFLKENQHKLDDGRYLAQDYMEISSIPNQVWSLYNPYTRDKIEVTYLDGTKAEQILLGSGEALMDELTFQLLGLDKMEEPIYHLKLSKSSLGQEVNVTIPIKIIGIFPSERDEESLLLEDTLTGVELGWWPKVYLSINDCNREDFPNLSFQRRIYFYSDTPELVYQATERLSYLETVSSDLEVRAFIADSVYQEQNEALENMQTEARTKAMIAMALLLLLGINLYSSFTNALNDRKFEIGVKRAVGATSWDIIQQFLYESIIVMMANIVLAVVVVIDICVVYKVIYEAMPDEWGNYYDWIIYVSPYSVAMFGICAITLTVVFSLIFAYKSTQVEIVQYLKAE